MTVDQAVRGITTDSTYFATHIAAYVATVVAGGA